MQDHRLQTATMNRNHLLLCRRLLADDIGASRLGHTLASFAAFSSSGLSGAVAAGNVSTVEMYTSFAPWSRQASATAREPSTLATRASSRAMVANMNHCRRVNHRLATSDRPLKHRRITQWACDNFDIQTGQFAARLSEAPSAWPARTRARTPYPRSSNSRTTQLPNNPVAPVTRIFCCMVSFHRFNSCSSSATPASGYQRPKTMAKIPTSAMLATLKPSSSTPARYPANVGLIKPPSSAPTPASTIDGMS